MKIMILILLTVYCLLPTDSTHAQTYDSVAAFTATTTFIATDIIPLQIKVSNKYTWRKITGLTLWGLIRDTTQAQLTTLKAAANTWSDIQTFSARPVFSGATFNAADWGAVTFADSLISTSRSEVNQLYPYSATSFIGSAADPFLRIYSKNFIVVGSNGSDSLTITYNEDDNYVSFDKPLSVELDSTNFTFVTYKPTSYSIATVADSIIDLSDKSSMVELVPPGNVSSPGISRILCSNAAVGTEITIYNLSGSYTIALKQYVSGDDNLFIAGDMTMSQNDCITLRRVGILPGTSWIEIGRSANVNAP